MNTKWAHYFWVTLQFGGIFYFLVSGSLFPHNLWVLLLLLDAMVLGLWAIFSMNRQTLSVLPNARPGASLTMKGPYRLLRHPMYTAVFEFLLALLINDFSWARLVVFGAVCVSLLAKVRIEERILTMKYPDYEEYKKSTKKLIPFVY